MIGKSQNSELFSTLGRSVGLGTARELPPGMPSPHRTVECIELMMNTIIGVWRQRHSPAHRPLQPNRNPRARAGSRLYRWEGYASPFSSVQGPGGLLNFPRSTDVPKNTLPSSLACGTDGWMDSARSVGRLDGFQEENISPNTAPGLGLVRMPCISSFASCCPCGLRARPECTFLSPSARTTALPELRG